MLFPKQRKRPLLQRMKAAGQIDFVLRVNYRAHGDVVQGPMEYFSLDQSTVAHRYSRYTREMHS